MGRKWREEEGWMGKERKGLRKEEGTVDGKEVVGEKEGVMTE